MIRETGELKARHCPNPVCKMFGRNVTYEEAVYCLVCGAPLVNSLEEYKAKLAGIPLDKK